MTIKNIVKSTDVWIALAASLIIFILMPDRINNGLAKDIYNVGISILSIVFSVFFAALALMVSASDNDFVSFLEEESVYTKLLAGFRYTMTLLLVALLFAVVMYVYSASSAPIDKTTQSRFGFALFSFLGLYGLFAALNAAHECLNFSKHRALYLKMSRKKLKEINNDEYRQSN